MYTELQDRKLEGELVDMAEEDKRDRVALGTFWEICSLSRCAKIISYGKKRVKLYFHGNEFLDLCVILLMVAS